MTSCMTYIDKIGKVTIDKGSSSVMARQLSATFLDLEMITVIVPFPPVLLTHAYRCTCLQIYGANFLSITLP